MSFYVCGCCQNILDGDEEPSEDYGGVELVCPACVNTAKEEGVAEDRERGKREEVIAFGMRKGR